MTWHLHNFYLSRYASQWHHRSQRLLAIEENQQRTTTTTHFPRTTVQPLYRAILAVLPWRRRQGFPSFRSIGEVPRTRQTNSNASTKNTQATNFRSYKPKLQKPKPAFPGLSVTRPANLGSKTGRCPKSRAGIDKRTVNTACMHACVQSHCNMTSQKAISVVKAPAAAAENMPEYQHSSATRNTNNTHNSTSTNTSALPPHSPPPVLPLPPFLLPQAPPAHHRHPHPPPPPALLPLVRPPPPPLAAVSSCCCTCP